MPENVYPLWSPPLRSFDSTNQHQMISASGTVYPKKYAHGFCFAVLCCGYTLTDFPISIRLTSLALWQSNDCPSASKATLMNMDKYFMWIHYERLHNHKKAKHNKTVCIFLGIYCSGFSPVQCWLCHVFIGNEDVVNTNLFLANMCCVCRFIALLAWTNPMNQSIKKTVRKFPFYSILFHIQMASILCLNRRLSKQSWGWWLETLSRPLWRHCNHICSYHDMINVSGMINSLFPPQCTLNFSVFKFWADPKFQQKQTCHRNDMR